MAAQPDIRCRHFIRLADVPAAVRLAAVERAARMFPDETPSTLLAAAMYPDPDHGEWVAEPLAQLLEREGVAA